MRNAYTPATLLDRAGINSGKGVLMRDEDGFLYFLIASKYAGADRIYWSVLAEDGSVKMSGETLTWRQSTIHIPQGPGLPVVKELDSVVYSAGFSRTPGQSDQSMGWASLDAAFDVSSDQLELLKAVHDRYLVMYPP